MGGTKIKKVEAEEPVVEAAEVVENINESARGDGEEGPGAAPAGSEATEDGRRDAEPAGPRAEEETKEAETKEEAPKKKSTKKPKKGHKVRSKKYQEVTAEFEKNELYLIPEAVELAKKTSYSKYDGSLEIHVVTAVKGLRGLVTLPYMSGKQLKILAFGKGAEDSGAQMVGTDAKLAEVARGKIDFDIIVTTPEWMPRLAALAKVLGPKGLMPNPKNGTISDDLKKAVTELQTGKTEYRTEANQKVLHLSLGKISQPSEELTQNVKTLLSTIGKSKVKKAVISPTLGPGIKLNLSSI